MRGSRSRWWGGAATQEVGSGWTEFPDGGPAIQGHHPGSSSRVIIQGHHPGASSRVEGAARLCARTPWHGHACASRPWHAPGMHAGILMQLRIVQMVGRGCSRTMHSSRFIWGGGFGGQGIGVWRGYSSFLMVGRGLWGHEAARPQEYDQGPATGWETSYIYVYKTAIHILAIGYDWLLAMGYWPF
jgi:hypothetical protein